MAGNIKFWAASQMGRSVPRSRPTEYRPKITSVPGKHPHCRHWCPYKLSIFSRGTKASQRFFNVFPISSVSKVHTDLGQGLFAADKRRKMERKCFETFQKYQSSCCFLEVDANRGTDLTLWLLKADGKIYIGYSTMS